MEGAMKVRLKTKFCSYCGKEVLFMSVDRGKYLYRIKDDDGVTFQCSYKCWRMETERKMDKNIIVNDAQKAVKYNARVDLTGGFSLTWKPSSYGIAIKWILGQRKITYDSFAKKLNGTTKQNVNHWLNRVPKERFTDEVLTEMCKALSIKEDYLYALSDEIEKIMEG